MEELNTLEIFWINQIIINPILCPVKYASSFYGPFRNATDINLNFTDRKTYQMSFKSSSEALREAEMDIKEGVDVIIKPALSYLDIIYKIKSKYNIPVIAYNVSGEYSMLKAVSEKTGFNQKRNYF